MSEELLKAMQEQNSMLMQLLQQQQANVGGVGRASTAQAVSQSGPSLDCLERQIRSFEYEPESGLTFESWYTRHESIFEADALSNDEALKVNVMLRHLGNKVHAQYTNFIIPRKPHEC